MQEHKGPWSLSASLKPVPAPWEWLWPLSVPGHPPCLRVLFTGAWSCILSAQKISVPPPCFLQHHGVFIYRVSLSTTGESVSYLQERYYVLCVLVSSSPPSKDFKHNFRCMRKQVVFLSLFHLFPRGQWGREEGDHLVTPEPHLPRGPGPWHASVQLPRVWVSSPGLTLPLYGLGCGHARGQEPWRWGLVDHCHPPEAGCWGLGPPQRRKARITPCMLTCQTQHRSVGTRAIACLGMGWDAIGTRQVQNSRLEGAGMSSAVVKNNVYIPTQYTHTHSAHTWNKCLMKKHIRCILIFSILFYSTPD